MLREDYYIRAGSRGIVFLGEDGREHILEAGTEPEEGMPIVVHPTTGDILTHGHEVINKGDTVIVVPLDDGDEAALKPAYSQDPNCKPIIKWVHDVSYKWKEEDGVPEDWIDEYKFRAYDIHLSEEFYREDHDMNITAYFSIYHNDRPANLSDQDHYGQVWFMFGYYGGSAEPGGYGSEDSGANPNINWYICGNNGNPYYTVRGEPWQTLGDDTPSGLVWNKPRICYMDAINDNVCNQSRCACTVDPIPSEEFPKGQPINFIHVYIDTVYSSYVYSYTKSSLHAIDICRQVPSDCEIRCYGGRNVYPPVPPYDPLPDDPEVWGEVVDEIW